MTVMLVAMGLIWLFIFFARLGMNKKIRTFDATQQRDNVVDMAQYRKKQ